MGKIGVMIVIHGYFANEALASAKMIIGTTPNARAYALTEDKTLDDLEKEIVKGYEELSNDYDIVLCICDIYGGTPFNAISRCLLNGCDMIAYTGLSLPLLIDVLLIKEIDRNELDARLRETQAQVLNEIKVSVVDVNDDIDEL